MTKQLAALAALLCVLGCGSPSTPKYVSENDQALAASRRGDHRGAAEHYERAASAADKPRDAEEARYRAARSFERAGDSERATTLYRQLAAQGPGSERAARADFALAELLLDAGKQADGQAALTTAIRRHSGSGLAGRALTRNLDLLRQQGGHAAVLTYLAAEEQALGGSELGETLAYYRARELDDAGETAAARDAYLGCATRFAYPRGAYWDDALYRAAEKELSLGAPQQALLHLSRLLRERESATLTGSYQRGRYAEAQLLIAHIYRDQLKDPLRARRELRRVWLDHPYSRLIDDALFEEALLAKAAGDTAGTCAPLDIVVRKLPDSRYAPCAHLLCTELAALPGRDCHDYIKRDAGLP